MTVGDAPRRLMVGDVDVAYRRAGAGSPLLYLHGMGLTRRWLDLHGALAERFDLIAPEHPGFGDTPRPAWYRDLDDIAVHYADVLTALELDRVHVVGQSLGALIAGSFAALFPERVRSLTVVTPAALPVVTPPEALAELDAPRPPGFDFDSLLLNDHQEAYPEFRDGDDEGLVVAPSDGDEYADPSAFRLEPAPSLYRRLARIRGPRQVIVPDEDRLFPHSTFEAWAHWLGGAPVVHIPGHEHPTGHLLIVQEPRAVADAIVALALSADEPKD